MIAAASTHPGEEIELVDVHRRLKHSFPGLLTILVPRHPERGAGIAGIASGAGLTFAQRSLGELPDRDTEIYVADTLGELGLIYRLAPIVFIGGSLVGHGGQNPIEAAKLGAAILHGPHVWNFAEIYSALDAAGGAEMVTDSGKLTVRIGAWLTDAEARKKVAQTGLAGDGHAGRRARAHRRGARSLSDAVPSGAARRPSRPMRTMREPAFWWRPAGPDVRRCCRRSPPIYGAVAAWRMAQPGARAGIPVICVGNLTLGGAGKTPAAIAVAQILDAAGRRPFLLSRGYGGALAGPGAGRSGAPSRRRGRRRAAAAGAGRADHRGARPRRRRATPRARPAPASIVMDDGFQNPALRKDRSILVVDGRRGIGNGKVFPAGPLRAPLEAQLRRADALLVVGAGSGRRGGCGAQAQGLPVFHGRLEPDAQALAALKGRPVLAFAGIGDPEKFFATLRDAGIEVARGRRISRPSPLPPAEARELIERAEREGLVLVTTEKDLARLAGQDDLAALAAVARALPVTLQVAEDGAFRDWVLTLSLLRVQPLHHRLGRGIGLLELDAPVFQLLERDRHAGHGAAHEGARPHDAEIPVEKLDLGLSRHRRRAIVAVQQRYSPSLTDKTPAAGVCIKIVARPQV